MPVKRSLPIAPCLVSVAWFAAACSPAVDGTSGVRLDGDRPIAVLAWCPGFEPAQVSVYTASPDGRVEGPVITLKRTGDAPAGSYLELDVLDPPAGWDVEESADLTDDGVYEIRAWNGDSSSAVRSFPFEMEELLSPSAKGKILTKRHLGDGRYESSFLTAEEFQEYADQNCDD